MEATPNDPNLHPKAEFGYPNLRTSIQFDGSATNLSNATSLTLEIELVTNNVPWQDSFTNQLVYSASLALVTNGYWPSNGYMLYTNAEAWGIITDTNRFAAYLPTNAAGILSNVVVGLPCFGLPSVLFDLQETGQDTSTFIHQALQATLTFATPPTNTVANSLTAQFYRNLSPAATLHSLTETAPGSLLYTNGDGTVSVKFEAMPAFDTNLFDFFQVTITNTGLQVTNYQVFATETDTNTLILTTPDEFDEEPWGGYWGFGGANSADWMVGTVIGKDAP